MERPIRADETSTASPPSRRMERVNALAHVLDDSIRIPGTNLRFGLDPVIGLVPGVGDAVAGLVSAYIVLQAARMGTPVPVLARMLLNVGIEALVGTIPVLGDLFDAGFKANLRNVNLLRGSVEAPGPTRRSSLLVVGGVVLALLGILALFVFMAIMVLQALERLVRGETVQV